MIINRLLEGESLTLSLEGMLNTDTASQLEKEIEYMPHEVKTLVLDLKKMYYISSAGLRVILRAEKKMRKKGIMIVKNVEESIMEVFEITGFSDLLKIE